MTILYVSQAKPFVRLGSVTMFSAWGAFVYRFRRPIALVSIAIAIVSSLLASNVTGALSAGGWTDPDSESTAVTTRLGDDFGAAGGSIVAVYRGKPGDDARSAAFQTAISDSLKDLLDDKRVDSPIGYAETHDDRFISNDGTSAYVVVRLNITDEEAVDAMDDFRALIHQPSDVTLQLTGVGPATQDQAKQSEKELVQAETVSFPFAALILILVFGSLVAAGMPLLVAALAIPTTLGGVFLAAQVTELSIYVQNVATMLGLALAIDGMSARPSRSRSRPAARPSRSPGWRSPSACPGCCSSSRPPCARSVSVAR
jgi:RND superfamily putative drug exporter